MRSPSKPGEISFFIPIEPVPASRPRVGKFGTYYAPKYRAFLDEAPKLVPRFETPLQGALQARFVFVVSKPRTGRLTHPRGDIDNYLKTVDALTKAGVWDDDEQIVEVHAIKRYAEPGEAPGIHVQLRKAA